MAVLGFVAAPVAQAAADAQQGIALPDLGGEQAESDAAAVNPCVMEADREVLGFDWSRRQLYRGICSTVRWFDGLFGDERFDDAAKGLFGRVAYTVERRERDGLNERPRFRLRVPLPNLNKRANFFIEREDERRSIEGRTGSDQEFLDPDVTPQSDTTQAGFAVRTLDAIDELVDLGIGIRLRQGEPNPFVRARYRKEFFQTDTSQFRLTQRFFYRHLEGWGESTQFDFETKLGDPWLLRWFNEGTWSQDTQGLDWRTGLGLYRGLGAGKALYFEISQTGQTDSLVKVLSRGARISYRQLLGRPWLIGEIYTGQDWPKSTPDATRDPQFFVGAVLEVHFGYAPK